MWSLAVEYAQQKRWPQAELQRLEAIHQHWLSVKAERRYY